MPILGTFNGATIVAMPATPAPKSISWTSQDVVAVSASPFTGQQQIQDWQAGWLEASVQMPPMPHLQAQAWIAFLMQARGQASVIPFGDPLAAQPQGSGGGAPVVSGFGQTGYTLVTKGWTPNAAGVLLPGDWLQVGWRLYRNLEAVGADANGNASLSIWPQLRESPNDGDAVVVRATRGLWRLKSSNRSWSSTEARIYGFQFELREAI